MTTSSVTLRPLEAEWGQHSSLDKKSPTSYEVAVDGHVIGRVRSRSQESWARSGRIRTVMIGHTRWWQATLAEGGDVGWKHYTRKDAVDALVAEVAAVPSR